MHHTQDDLDQLPASPAADTPSLYAVEIDLDNRNTSHTQVVELVGRDQRVLDVGCWTGELGRVLATRGCQVRGIEIDAAAAAIAGEHLEEVLVADLDRERLPSLFGSQTFDAIVFADVLEHITDPRQALADAVTLLAPGGRIVVSIPNVTHGSLRLALLQGSWTLTDTGLLDRTHIKFYSRSGLLDLLASAGLVVDDLRGTLSDPLRTEVPVDEDRLPDHVVEWVRDQPDALVYQFQLVARPAGADEQPGSAPDLVPAGVVDEVRLDDIHAVNHRVWRRDQLTQRDHVIGLQATATSARQQARREKRRANRLAERLERQKKRSADLQQRVQRLEAELAARRRGPVRVVASRVRRLLRG